MIAPDASGGKGFVRGMWAAELRARHALAAQPARALNARATFSTAGITDSLDES